MTHHHERQCDKCQKIVEDGLMQVPFLYLDMNDKEHPDLGRGYRQYAVCKSCWKRGY